MEEDYAKRSERVKALLSQYYGDGSATGPAAGPGQPAQQQSAAPGRGPQGGHVAGLAAIDTPTFNADQHTSDILRIFSLEKLMVEHRNMAREIKNLDSDMQQLVYENYNKFITATDTIRTMKSSVDNMETEMQRLEQTASVVAEKSLSVSNKLQQRRESMEQLYKVQRLLRKLQTVFELPRKMRAALEEDALDTAVGLYAEAQPLLHKYGNRGTFKVIALESDFVAQEISQLLKKRLTERKDDAEQCVLLLRKLGEPDDTLQDKYLSGRVARIKRVLAEAAVVADAMAAAAAGQQQVPLPNKAQVAAPEAWNWTAAAGPPPLRAFVRSLDEKFISGVQETVVNVIRFFLPEGSEDSPEAAAAKRKPLVALSRELFAEYFGIVRRVVTDAAKAGVLRGSLLREARAVAAAAAGGKGGPGGGGGAAAALSVNSPSLQQLGSDWGAEPIAQALSTMSTDVGLLAGHLPELGLKERAAEVVQAAVQQHVTLSFAALKQRVIDAAVCVRTALQGAAPPGAAAGGGAAAAAGGGAGAEAGASGASAAGGGGGGGGSEAGGVLRAGSEYLVELLQRGLAALLQGLRGYESAGGPRLLSSWRDAWVELVQGGLQGFFVGLLTASLELAALRYDGGDLMREALKASGSGAAAAAGPDLMGPPPGAAAGGQELLVKPALVLLLAKLCKFLEQVMVPWVMETIAASFASGGGLMGGGSGGPGVDLPPAFVPGEVARRLSAASSAMVLAYVEMHGRQLSVMVRRSTASVSWLTCKEPRGPRPVCSLLLERLAKLQAEAAALLEEGDGVTGGLGGGGGGMGAGGPGRKSDDHHRGAGDGRGMYGGAGAFGGGDTAAVERNVAKLFREKVHMTGSVALSCPAILAAVAAVALKSLLESIRLETLGRAGLQQLQLDVAFLRPQLRRCLLRGGGGKGDGTAVVEQLLEDVVLSGTERCVEPALLEAAVVERILASASSAD